jgi:hypothetical protein
MSGELYFASVRTHAACRKRKREEEEETYWQ